MIYQLPNICIHIVCTYIMSVNHNFNIPNTFLYPCRGKQLHKEYLLLFSANRELELASSSDVPKLNLSA